MLAPDVLLGAVVVLFLLLSAALVVRSGLGAHGPLGPR